MLKKVFSNILLAEDWTPGKQLASVFLLALLLLPLVLGYVFRSQLITLLRDLFA